MKKAQRETLRKAVNAAVVTSLASKQGVVIRELRPALSETKALAPDANLEADQQREASRRKKISEAVRAHHRLPLDERRRRKGAHAAKLRQATEASVQDWENACTPAPRKKPPKPPPLEELLAGNPRALALLAMARDLRQEREEAERTRLEEAKAAATAKAKAERARKKGEAEETGARQARAIWGSK